MRKIMFDSNIFDVLPNYITKLKQLTKEYEFFITTIQTDEIADISDDKKRKRRQNFLMLADLRPKVVSLSLGIWDLARFDYMHLGPAQVYYKLLNPSGNNKHDAAIADTAVREGCTLVTNDMKLYRKMKKYGYSVLTFEEFLGDI